MNKYLATVLIKGQSIKTVVFAKSQLHAKLILQYQFGMNSIIVSPVITEKIENIICVDELVKQVKAIKPLSPEQARIQNLKNRINQDKLFLQAEKSRQQQQKISKKMIGQK